MKKLFGLCIVLVLSYWMIRPFFIPGYFPMHDDTQVARVVEMGRALRQGQFPVRWVSGLGYGYGYPIFNFYGPLPYYVGGFFYALGLTGLTAAKIMMGLGMVAAGVTMFFAVSDIVGISGGILAAVLYMYAPYHAVDGYVRGAVGEYWALIFLPLIFWGFWRKKILTGALGVAGLIVSHTILGYAGMLFVGIAVLGAKMRKDMVIMVLLGLGLSAFFWLPAIWEMKYTNVASQVSATANFRDHFVCLPQLWNSLWGYGGSATGCLDGFSFKIGKIHLIIGFLALLLIKKRMYLFAGVSILLLSVFFMLPISSRIWELLPNFAYIQYPWRFLAFAIFGISVGGSAIVLFFHNRYIRWFIVSCFVIFVIVVESKWFVPQYTYSRVWSEFETKEDIQYRVSKISDEYLPASIIRPVNADQGVRDILSGSDYDTVKIIENKDTYKKFEFISGKENQIKVNIVYFPGWIYRVNDSYVVPRIQNGLPILSIPAGLTVVQMWFTDTPVRKIGNIVSIGALGTCLYLYDRKNKKTIS